MQLKAYHFKHSERVGVINDTIGIDHYPRADFSFSHEIGWQEQWFFVPKKSNYYYTICKDNNSRIGPFVLYYYKILRKTKHGRHSTSLSSSRHHSNYQSCFVRIIALESKLGKLLL